DSVSICGALPGCGALSPRPRETNSSFFLRQKAIYLPESTVTGIISRSGAPPQKRRAAYGVRSPRVSKGGSVLATRSRADGPPLWLGFRHLQLTAKTESGVGDDGIGFIGARNSLCLRFTRVTPGRIFPASHAATKAATTRASYRVPTKLFNLVKAASKSMA